VTSSPVLQLSFRVPASRAVGPGMFVTEAGDGLTRDRCWHLLQTARRIAFLVHGFNVSWESGRDSLRRLGAALQPSFDGLVIAVTWPGDSGLGPLGYPWEGRDADDTGLALAKIIGEHVGDGAELSFVTHSLGARVALEACARLDPVPRLPAPLCLGAGPRQRHRGRQGKCDSGATHGRPFLAERTRWAACATSASIRA